MKKANPHSLASGSQLQSTLKCHAGVISVSGQWPKQWER